MNKILKYLYEITCGFILFWLGFSILIGVVGRISILGLFLTGLGLYLIVIGLYGIKLSNLCSKGRMFIVLSIGLLSLYIGILTLVIRSFSITSLLIALGLLLVIIGLCIVLYYTIISK